MGGMRTVVWWVLALLAMGLAGCGGEEPVDPEAGKLVVIGIDSADWRLRPEGESAP